MQSRHEPSLASCNMSDSSIAEDAPAPRLCHLIKWPDFDGYGFNLHAERSNPGQFIGKIDEDSPAAMAGLKEGDRIIEVNGVNINNENHRQVVERIKSNPDQAKLLVLDSEADLWYKEHEIIVKASQANVVYMKTPTPRPDSDSPRAKFHQPPEQIEAEAKTAAVSPTAAGQCLSLETSDFNSEDSIEPAASNQSTKPPTPPPVPTAEQLAGGKAALSATNQRKSPPMSPDSGRGDDDAIVTVEAEVNRQSPVKHHLVAAAAAAAAVEIKMKKQQQQQELDNNKNQADNLNNNSSNEQQDSNSKSESNCIEKAMTQTKANDFGEVRNGSADSGQSSTSSSSSSSSDSGSTGSIDDSLENNNNNVEDNHKDTRDGVKSEPRDNQQEEEVISVAHSLKQAEKTQSLSEEDKQTVRNYQQAGKQPQATSESSQTEKLATSTTTPIIKSAAAAATTTDPLVADNNAVAMKFIPAVQVAKVAAADNDETTTTEQPTLKPALVNSSFSKKQPQLAEQADQPEQQQLQTAPQKTTTTANNNNHSGLNLNMTASEMRELIASRKKFDPKKAQMNIRQKYEIIQQM